MRRKNAASDSLCLKNRRDVEDQIKKLKKVVDITWLVNIIRFCLLMKAKLEKSR